jgi:alanine dehydrogenase
MHITNLGGFELDEEVFKRATVTVRQGVGGAKLEPEERVQRGRGHSPIAYVAGNEQEMARLPKEGGRMAGMGSSSYPSFTDLAGGKIPGRTSDDDVTLYLNGGNQGLQFAAVGSVVYEAAKQQGLGHEIPTSLFLQDIRD